MQDADAGPDPGRPGAAAAALLSAAVREAGDIALKAFRAPVKQWTKGELSPVSEVDIAVDDFLRVRLATPGYAWLSEETEDDPVRLDADHVWIVDPIDGTRAYLAGRPDWTISIALASHGRPVLGGVFAPVTQELFLATAGGGTTLNGKPVRASGGDDLNGSKASGPKRHLDFLLQADRRVVSMPRIGSLALRIARVAHGGLDVAFAGGHSHDWDLAAADLLVHEAGGAMTSLAGRTLIYNRPKPVHDALIAAGRDRHAMLIKLARDRLSELT